MNSNVRVTKTEIGDAKREARSSFELRGSTSVRDLGFLGFDLNLGVGCVNWVLRLSAGCLGVVA